MENVENIVVFFVSIFLVVAFLKISHIHSTINSWNKIRVLKKTTLGGDTSYQIQKKFLFLFWINAIEFMSMYYQNLSFEKVLEAKEYVDNHIKKQEDRKKARVIKKEVLDDFVVYKNKLLIEKVNNV